MNRIRTIRRWVACLAALAGALLAFCAASPPAFAYRLPPGGLGGPVTPAPAVHHVIVSSGMPGWQITLIAASAAAVAAVLAVTLDRARAARRHLARAAT